MKKSYLLGAILLIASSTVFGQMETNQDEKLTQLIDPAEPCVNGFAGIYPCSGYDLQSRMTLAELGGTAANDCWGWTDPLDQKEYAIVGLSNGTAFVDITNPHAPVHLGNLATHSFNSLWRDIKVYQNHAYIVSEAGSHGMQIFDLTRLRNVVSPPETFTEDGHYDFFGSAHNIVINEASGFAYPVGTSLFAGGPIFVDLSNPVSPALAGSFDSDGYTHDAQVVIYNGPDLDHQNSEIFLGSNENTLTIVDVTNKSNPVQLSRVGYTGVAYTHQGWLTEDQEYYLMDDEVDETSQGINTRTLIWDVRDLDNPIYIGDFISSIGASDHNLYTKDGKAYQANYRGGLRVLDLSDVANANLVEEGYFDTYPESNTAGFSTGAWSNYPYYPSGNIIISSQDRGLFIVKASSPDPVAVNLTLNVNLQGPYNSTDELMEDDLRVAGLIPLQDPYSGAGFSNPAVVTNSTVLSQTGNDAIVDWILVEFRNGNNPSEITNAVAGLLQRDGDIIAADGGTLIMENVTTENVYVAIRHRNHLGFRTDVLAPTSSDIVYNLSNNTVPLFGIDPVETIGSKNVMISGEANSDGQINTVDNNLYWRAQNGQVFSYTISTADFNLDGTINTVDKNLLWRPNNGKAEQLD